MTASSPCGLNKNNRRIASVEHSRKSSATPFGIETESSINRHRNSSIRDNASTVTTITLHLQGSSKGIGSSLVNNRINTRPNNLTKTPRRFPDLIPLLGESTHLQGNQEHHTRQASIKKLEREGTREETCVQGCGDGSIERSY